MFAPTLDHVAIVGYSLLLVFVASKIMETYKRPMDLVANVLIIVGLASLIKYHYTKLVTKKDESNDAEQKRVRLVAHTTISAFFLLTLTRFSAARFQSYDWFGFIAHTFLIMAVYKDMSQLAGVLLLAAYFGLATYNTFGKGGMELVQLAGRAIMFVFFSASFMQGVHMM